MNTALNILAALILCLPLVALAAVERHHRRTAAIALEEEQ